MKKDVFDCLLCGVPLNDSVTWNSLLGNEYLRTICAECESEFEPVPKSENSSDATSLFKYNEKMQDYLHRYKFMHDVVLSKVFRNQLRKHLSKRQEILVPIPIHAQKLNERTFAHIDELLIAANIPFKHFLEKLTIETQAQKSREERINTPQLFKLKQNVRVKNKDIILVDDIITTGTTIQHAKNLFLQEGAKSVKAFTLIRG